MSERILEELSKLAESTGVAVEKLYVILEQQAKVQLVYDVLIIIGIIIAFIVGIILSKHFFKKSSEDGYFSTWEFPAILSSVFTGIVGFFGGVVGIPCLIAEIVQILINPQVWILEYIMNLIK